MKTVIVDIDGTLCQNTDGDYPAAQPIREAVLKVNSFYEQGWRVVLWTSRGVTTGKNWEQLTRDQIQSWGVLHHELMFGKPHYDMFICDKAHNASVLHDEGVSAPV